MSDAERARLATALDAANHLIAEGADEAKRLTDQMMRYRDGLHVVAAMLFDHEMKPSEKALRGWLEAGAPDPRPPLKTFRAVLFELEALRNGMGSLSEVIEAYLSDEPLTETSAEMYQKMRCGACSADNHAECSGYCFCPCQREQPSALVEHLREGVEDARAGRVVSRNWRNSFAEDEDMMRVDMREHPGVRDAVHAGLAALRVQARQIWGPDKHMLGEIVVRLMVGVGDLARAARDTPPLTGEVAAYEARREIKKELGNVLLSTIRWIDDLGFDAMECLDLAIAAQEKFAKSGRPR